MLTNILPAAGFAAATSAPAVLGSALDLLHLAGRHLTGLCILGVIALLALVVWGETREASRQESINAADAEWSATGRPVKGWGPGWVWSGWTPEPTAEEQLAEAEAALVAEDPVDVRPFRPTAEMRSGLCASCKSALASATIRYADGTEFRVCGACAPAGVEIDAHVPTTFGRAS